MLSTSPVSATSHHASEVFLFYRNKELHHIHRDRKVFEQWMENSAWLYPPDRCEIVRYVPAGHAQTPADTYRETVRKVAATREKRRAELQEAVVAAHAAFEAIPIGFPLQQNGRTIDHTLLNEAKRLCELALSGTSTDRQGE